MVTKIRMHRTQNVANVIHRGLLITSRQPSPQLASFHNAERFIHLFNKLVFVQELHLQHALAVDPTSQKQGFASMASSAISWLSEMELDNPIFTAQFDFMDPLEDDLAAVLGQDFEIPCLSPINETLPFCISADDARPPLSPETQVKHHKPNDFSTFSMVLGPNGSVDRASSTPIILNFGKPTSPEKLRQGNKRNDEEAALSDGGLRQAQNVNKTGRVRPPSQTYDHIIAERKRREQLSQRFVVLSSIVPGLKKMDKTSVLGDAIKYLKYLQERVKLLEEQATKKSMESVVLVTKSRTPKAVNGDEDPSAADKPLPKIEVRACNTQILIRIHCEYQKGLLPNIIADVENLNLTVVNTCIASFGMMVLDITIITEIEKGFSLTVNEVVRRIRTALQRENA